jgi:hypothetical protein
MLYDLCVEWGAKVIFGMQEELEAWNRGWDFYHASYVAAGLAWQNIMYTIEYTSLKLGLT